MPVMARGRAAGLRLELPKRRRGSDARRLLGIGLIIWGLFLAVQSFALLASHGGQGGGKLIVVDTPEGLRKAASMDGVVLLYFRQDFCAGCEKMEPAVERLAAERSDVKVVKVDISAMMERVGAYETLRALAEWRVTGTPTLILLRDGKVLARHSSTFGLGDQYQGLRRFVEEGLAGRWRGVSPGGEYTGLPSEVAEAFTPLAVARAAGEAYVLGLLAAFSPCSLPMLLAYGALGARGGGRRGPGARELAVKWLLLFSTVVLAGSLLVLAYVASARVPLVNPYGLLLGLLGSILVAWGLLMLRRGELLLVNLPAAEKLLPLLGLQCSLPFLMVLVATVNTAPHLVFTAAAAFALGYTLPYTLADSAASMLEKAAALATRRAAVLLQATLLIAAGLYALHEAWPVLRPA